jgi:hypothetical protein
MRFSHQSMHRSGWQQGQGRLDPVERPSQDRLESVMACCLGFLYVLPRLAPPPFVQHHRRRQHDVGQQQDRQHEHTSSVHAIMGQSRCHVATAAILPSEGWRLSILRCERVEHGGRGKAEDQPPTSAREVIDRCPPTRPIRKGVSMGCRRCGRTPRLRRLRAASDGLLR